jgi:dihydrofolate reductase
MRTVTYGAACSLDGFITARDGALDWLHMSRDVHQVTAAYWETIDTILMGRKTWDVAQALGGGPPGALDTRTTYVFSRTLDPDTVSDVHIVSTDPGGFVRDLKRHPGKDICVMSGGDLAQSLFGAGVIDEVQLNIHPVLLGSGVPLFRDPGHRIGLTLAECRTIAGDCLLVKYRRSAEG